MDGRVAAVEAPDGPGASRVAGTRGQRIVRALARGAADRVDRGQVHDVEAHAGDLGQSLDHVGECPVAPRRQPLGAREQLVPGGEARLDPVGHHRQLAVEARQIAPLLRPGHRLFESRLEQHVELCRLVVGAGQPVERGLEEGGIGAVGALARAPDQLGALGDLAGQVGLARRRPAAHLLHPRSEDVGPGLDRVPVARIDEEGERSGPRVIVRGLERRLAPVGVRLGAVADHRGEPLMPLLQDVGGDLEPVAHLALDREAPAVHRGTNALDQDRPAHLRGARVRHRQRSVR